MMPQLSKFTTVWRSSHSHNNQDNNNNAIHLDLWSLSDSDLEARLALERPRER